MERREVREKKRGLLLNDLIEIYTRTIRTTRREDEKTLERNPNLLSPNRRESFEEDSPSAQAEIEEDVPYLEAFFESEDIVSNQEDDLMRPRSYALSPPPLTRAEAFETTRRR